MSRLPDLERALFDAAARLDAQATGNATASEERRHARRWRRRGTPLLAGLVSLLVAGAAVAAVTGLLDSGDPVPHAAGSPLEPVPAATGFTLASVRTSDPGGGPKWGIGTYDAIPTAVPAGERPASAALAARLRSRRPVTCVVVGRIQDGQLGVVGRDGVFADDGRFHALAPAAQSSSACAGRAENGTFVSMNGGPPIPASGYTGPPGTAIGGCRERVNLDGPTVSPQTRRKLEGVPRCSADGLRHVVAGFAGPHAATATLTGARSRRTLRLLPGENGAYLFVLRWTAGPSPRLTITDRSGTVCRPFVNPPETAAQRAAVARNASNCAGLHDTSPDP
jgi:hypothetical protein